MLANLERKDMKNSWQIIKECMMEGRMSGTCGSMAALNRASDIYNALRNYDKLTDIRESDGTFNSDTELLPALLARKTLEDLGL